MAKSVQKFLDGHFTNPEWGDFKKKLRSPKFVSAVAQDDRADDKLKRYAENNGRHLQAKGAPTYKVPSQSGGKPYTVKFHSDIDSFSCDCGDWIHKQSTKGTGGECKHVRRLKSKLKMLDTVPTDSVRNAMSKVAAVILGRVC